MDASNKDDTSASSLDVYSFWKSMSDAEAIWDDDQKDKALDSVAEAHAMKIHKFLSRYEIFSES